MVLADEVGVDMNDDDDDDGDDDGDGDDDDCRERRSSTISMIAMRSRSVSFVELDTWCKMVSNSAVAAGDHAWRGSHRGRAAWRKESSATASRPARSKVVMVVVSWCGRRRRRATWVR